MSDPRPTESEPDPRPRSPLARVLAVGAGLAVAAVAWLAAPEVWEAGPGLVRVSYQGSEAQAIPVPVGTGEPLELVADVNGIEISVEFPEGIPTHQTIPGRVALTRSGTPISGEPGGLEVTLVLADGREEPIPSLRSEGDEILIARTPPVDAGVTLGLLALVVTLWVSEAIPLHITSLLIPVVLVVADVADATAATAPFANPIIVLFFAGFLMAEAMRRSGLDHFAAVAIVARAGRSPAMLFATMIAVAAFASMWMSNTAAAAVLIPIALAITGPLNHGGYKRALILGIAYAATIGGVGSAIGTPANQLAIEFLDSYGNRSISFAGWFAIGLPMVVLFLPVMGIVVWARARTGVDASTFRAARESARRQLAQLGRLTRDQIVVLSVFAVVAAGWLTQPYHDIHPGIVALAGAVVLAIAGRIQPADLGRISWAALLTFGGGLTLGVFLIETGVSDWIAVSMTGLGNLPTLPALAALAAATLLLTTVASNTASAAILIPLSIPLASVVGVDPLVMAAVVAVASSIDFALVIGTPPTMIAYSTELFTAGQIFRKGIVLDLLGLAVLVLAVVPVWDVLGAV